MARRLIILFLLFLLTGCGGQPTQDTSTTGWVEEVGEASKREQDVEPPQPEAPIRRNHRPEVVGIRLEPRLVYPGVKLKAVVEVEDRDGDPVVLEYRWTRNGRVLEEVTDELDTDGFKKGDLIRVTVIPYDGKEEGEAVSSSIVVLANRPPRITSTPPARLVDGGFLYRVEASDSDGDPLTYTLVEGPDGMVLSPDGLLKWESPKEGEHLVRIQVSDGEDIAFQEFSLTIKGE